MEGKENMVSGVTVIAAEAPSNYHVAPRPDGPPQVTVSPSVVTPTSTIMAGIMEKKKRGRPRKYGPDGSGVRTLSPMPITASAPPLTGTYSSGSGKRGRGRLSNSDSKHDHRVEMRSMGDGGACSDGAHFTPHVITVNAGEDVTARIISFCQQGPRAICILSANGMVSNATLRQSDSSGGTLTYEGRFEIVNLCGSFTPTEREGTRFRAGGLSVSLSSPNGQVVGGCVAGLLVAAAPVQIIVGSFLPSTQPEHKPKKQKVQALTYPASAIPALPAPPPSAKDEPCNNGQGQNIPSPAMQQPIMPPPFQREAWPNAHSHSMQDSRKAATDINISLPGGSTRLQLNKDEEDEDGDDDGHDGHEHEHGGEYMDTDDISNGHDHHGHTHDDEGHLQDGACLVKIRA
ncbi:hypothetical protein V2J09_018251 [Rumex salicifolius]